MNTGFVYKLFGVANFNQYFYNDNTQISLINDRFSILNEIEDTRCVIQIMIRIMNSMIIYGEHDIYGMLKRMMIIQNAILIVIGFVKC